MFLRISIGFALKFLNSLVEKAFGSFNSFTSALSFLIGSAFIYLQLVTLLGIADILATNSMTPAIIF